MEKDGDAGPDAASIKPVSSLRAKFENLHGSTPSENNAPPTKGTSTTAGLKPVEPTKQPGFIRASLDLPRLQSPWSSRQPETPNIPQTTGPVKRMESPTRSNHKRPMSMLIQSSPQLTPALQVDSPSSPPRGLFARNASTSPERGGTSAFEKLKELASQHSSRSSTAAPTPGDQPVDASADALTDTIQSTKPNVPSIRPRSPIPPPINRAEKPKIPAKPQNITSPPEPGLGTRPLAFLSERRVSPFSTPPSSDEEDKQLGRSQGQLLPRQSLDLPVRASFQSDVSRISEVSDDPRLMGFASARPVPERKDPRSLGFSTAQSPPQPGRELKIAPSSARSITPLSTGPVKDARDLGFGSSTPTTRQAPPLPRPARPSPPRQAVPAQSAVARDPRQYGFSTPGVPSAPIAGTIPNLPQRSTSKAAPPRPSDDSKRPTYTPGIMRAPPMPRIARQPSASIPAQARSSEDIPRQNMTQTVDVRFPPPPKRGTFDDAGPHRSDSLSMPTPPTTRRKSFDVGSRQEYDSDEAEEQLPEPSATRHDYPDGTHTNRRPPIHDASKWQFHTKTDGKVFDICGRLLCTASYHTRIVDLETGEELLALNHGETVKSTSILFKPGADIKSEGKRIWIGNNIGDLQEIDLETQVIIAQSSAHNKAEIFRIFRHQRDLWTLDEAGKLFVWPADETGVPNMKYSHIPHKLHTKPTYAMVVQDTLWAATGKETRVYRPGNEVNFNVRNGPLQLVQAVGDVTCGTYSEGQGRVYLGHNDGKVTIYSLEDYSCLGNVKVSDYKINAMTMVGHKLWAVYKTGKVYVYDTSNTPWKIEKDWKAHNGPATGILLDPSSVWLLGRMQVATTGHDQYVRLWDGMLEEDWVESTMNERDVEYCTFRNVRAAVTSWNCGATNPILLRTDFIADAIHADEPDPPEILVFGFQEVVDLEDRTVTAKSIFGFGKKKESKAQDQHHQSKVYREWRDYLARSISKYIPQHAYSELHTSSLIGLLQCVFVRTNERRNIFNSTGEQVKCGMGGHYGNKGALLHRFILDSSSLCFVNCHLAAGQSSTSHRNNDVATILESESLPAETNLDTRSSIFVGGGDGKQILDHETCILNGDLNYRIDTLPRAVVIKHIDAGDLSKLLERDQLNVSRRRVAGFRLAPFTELPITFPPTYKYDIGSDQYDSSEKKRSPAWCDRILFRSPAGRVKQLEYRRHEGVYYSDHRPVSGLFRIQVKKVDETKRKVTMKSVYKDFETMRRAILEEGCVAYLVGSFGIERSEAKKLIRGVK